MKTTNDYTVTTVLWW